MPKNSDLRASELRPRLSLSGWRAGYCEATTHSSLWSYWTPIFVGYELASLQSQPKPESTIFQRVGIQGASFQLTFSDIERWDLVADALTCLGTGQPELRGARNELISRTITWMRNLMYDMNNLLVCLWMAIKYRIYLLCVKNFTYFDLRLKSRIYFKSEPCNLRPPTDRKSSAQSLTSITINDLKSWTWIVRPNHEIRNFIYHHSNGLRGKTAFNQASDSPRWRCRLKRECGLEWGTNHLKLRIRC